MPRDRQVVIVTHRYRPHQILFLFVALISGILYSFGAPPPASLVSEEPKFVIRLWSVGLLLTGLFGLYSVVISKDTIRSLKVEGGAMLIGAGAIFMYSSAVISFGGVRGMFASLTGIAWMLANVWRFLQIRQDLNHIKNRAKDG